jgi:glucose-6-phosphate 1-dehydrogenase
MSGGARATPAATASRAAASGAAAAPRHEDAPLQVVIFGATGDLALRKLVPALARLVSGGSLGRPLVVVGVSRSERSDEAFRKELAEATLAQARAEGAENGRALREGFEALAPHLFYQAADAADEASLETLSERLDALPGGRDTGRLFYLALKPSLFGPAVRELGRAGLLAMVEGERRCWRRVVIEKPFGHDLESARALNATLHERLHEQQIYRIDHYLGKETVQNLLGFRFHNAIFEPLWNREHVELVEIQVAETVGMESGRAGYYDESGAMRDMLQNHMLQILALVAMEPPVSLEPDAIRDQKLAALRGLHPPDPQDVGVCSVRARYGAGRVGGAAVRGYLEEEGVPSDSTTETFVALRAEIGSWRWSGVPFLLRHGKRLAKRFTEVKVQFRTPPVQLFNRPEGVSDGELRRMLRDGSLCQMRPNVLTLCIQPHEGIRLSFGVKQPGPHMTMAPATLGFDYAERFGAEPPGAYERLLLDALRGDPTLFLRADEIETAWRFVDDIRAGWQGEDAPPLLEYPAGSFGPDEAQKLFQGCEGTWSRGEHAAEHAREDEEELPGTWTGEGMRG